MHHGVPRIGARDIWRIPVKAENVPDADRSLWHDGIVLFPAGTPFANHAGIEVLRGPRDYTAVRQALAQAGYNGEQIVVVGPTDVQPIPALSLVGTDQLGRSGMNVDLQELEQGASNRRRQNQAASDKRAGTRFLGFKTGRSRPTLMATR
jgi:hypothetical protein